MNASCTDSDLEAIQQHLAAKGLAARLTMGVERTIVGVLGQIDPDLEGELGVMSGVDEVIRISKPYKLASREFNPIDTVLPGS